MPDVSSYAQAWLVTAITSTAMLLAVLRLAGLRRVGRPFRPPPGWIGIPAVAAGLLVGYRLLEFTQLWPPVTALSRLLAILLPAVFAVEWLSALWPAGNRWMWLLRALLSFSAVRILLHGSVYLQPATFSAVAADGAAGLHIPVAAGMGLCGVGLLMVWYLLRRLAARPGAPSLVWSLVLSLHTAGLAILLGGYIRGGEAAIPLTAACLATSIAAWLWLGPADSSAQLVCQQSLLSIALLALFGLLCTGCCFGKLPVSWALAIFLAPLLSWLTELPRLRTRPVGQQMLVRLLLTAVPLLIVSVLAKREFDVRMAPLLTRHAVDNAAPR